MSYLVADPEGRFSHDEALIIFDRIQPITLVNLERYENLYWECWKRTTMNKP